MIYPGKFRHVIWLLLGLLPLSGALYAADKENIIDPYQAELPLEDLRTFTKVYDHIRKGYVEEITDKTLLEYAIKGMLSELDPHSAYLNENLFDDLQIHTTGEFGGLGIEVGMEDGFVKVVSPIDDTPAAKAGVEAGDLIIKIDTKSVKGLSLGEAIELMRGPKDSEITLTIVREGTDKPFKIDIIRDTIKVQSVKHKILEDDFGYIRISQFQVNTGKDTQAAIKLMTSEQVLKGIILDLRNNPGGVLQASVDVVSAFLDSGLVVYTEGRVKNADVKYNAEAGDSSNGLPIVVLINDGSASASEIVAGALQDHRRAVIMGTQSFGKGSVQTVIPLSEDKAIKLTTALYFTPNGRSIQAQGINPDIEIERAKITALKPRPKFSEANLNGHLNNGNGLDDRSEDQRRAAIEKNKELFNNDNQLFEAVNLLRGLSLFNANQSDVEPTPETAPKG
jgi:carboxyl-terminal processing protease